VIKNPGDLESKIARKKGGMQCTCRQREQLDVTKFPGDLKKEKTARNWDGY